MNQIAIETNTPHDSRSLEAGKRIAFIQACWHKDIVDQARESFLVELGRIPIEPDCVELFEVPGSLELPLQAQLLARTERYAVIVAAGFVVNGGIYRHEFGAQTVVDALMRVQLKTEVPILSVVLTPHNFQPQSEHENFFQRHFKIKGAEAAVACAMTLRNLIYFIESS